MRVCIGVFKMKRKAIVISFHFWHIFLSNFESCQCQCS